MLNPANDGPTGSINDASAQSSEHTPGFPIAGGGMTITFKARVLVELGAELISSDAVALYELIKNGVDAGSKKIEIDIRIAMQRSARRQLHLQYDNYTEAWEVDRFLSDVDARIEPTASSAQREAFAATLGKPTTHSEALERLDAAAFKCNSISIIDRGKGMTAAELTTRYLTIGTPARLHEREAAKSKHDRIPLGEKGIGRLAAMRLGHYVMVRTGVRDDHHLNILELDWRPVFNDIDLDASALSFTPESVGGQKELNESGTEIRIQDLQSDWDIEKLQSLSRTDLAKLADPFLDNFANQFVVLRYQEEKRAFIGGFQESLLRHADATCEIEFRSEGGDRSGPRLQVTTSYDRFGKSETVVHEAAHLASIVSYPLRGKRTRARASDRLPGADEIAIALNTLGDFSAKFFWFNRGRIMRDDGDLWRSTLQAFVRGWSGGLLVYRDGFRVYPYGAEGDDWLELDRKALASSAFKLNRAQIVGYLRLSSARNPRLQDQTNREGLRDCPEKKALIGLLRHSIVTDCKTFLERIDKENKSPTDDDIHDMDERIVANQRAAANTLKVLAERVPQERDAIGAVLAQLAEVTDAWDRAKNALSAHDAEVEQYLHLAGVGLMVELIAHELARATDNALELLSKKTTITNHRQLESLEAQLKTLNKRLRVLDELSIPGRQRKAVHDIGDVAQLIRELYEAKTARHGINVTVIARRQTKLRCRVEKGQILQILDNLMSNSIYWLVRRLDRTSAPSITIEIDSEAATLRFTDNGPGIPASVGAKVFDAFYTTKPSGEGRGLGLFIAKRLAKDNNAELSLLPIREGRSPGFQIEFTGN